MSNPNRLEKNLEILDKLSHYLKENPMIRFGQALSNLNLATHRKQNDEYTQGYDRTGYDDIFFEEPEETLDKMRNVNKESGERAESQGLHIEHLTWEQVMEKYGDVLTEKEIEKLKSQL